VLSKQLSVRETERLKDKLTTSSARSREEEAYADIARTLSHRLGTKVRFTSLKRGKIEISYHSEEELNAILKALGYEL
jgi:ParB family chromosome partitioning protein